MRRTDPPVHPEKCWMAHYFRFLWIKSFSRWYRWSDGIVHRRQHPHHLRAVWLRLWGQWSFVTSQTLFFFFSSFAYFLSSVCSQLKKVTDVHVHNYISFFRLSRDLDEQNSLELQSFLMSRKIWTETRCRRSKAQMRILRWLRGRTLWSYFSISFPPQWTSLLQLSAPHASDKHVMVLTSPWVSEIHEKCNCQDKIFFFFTLMTIME